MSPCNRSRALQHNTLALVTFVVSIGISGLNYDEFALNGLSNYSDPYSNKNLWGTGPYLDPHCSEHRALQTASELLPILLPGSVVGGAWAGRTFLLALRSPSITQAELEGFTELRAERNL